MWLRTSAVEAHALYESVDAAARAARRSGDPRTLEQLRADLLVARGLGGAPCGGHTELDGHTPAGPDPAAPPDHASCPPAIRADIRVLVPLSTLVGTGDEPAELVGYGPIDPATARALAQGGTWRRLVTDPVTGVVLDVGRTRYRPPAGLAELVRFRDGTCVRPGCDVPAWASELDHTVPFSAADDGGPTAAHNLGALSKGCHDLKTHGGFQLEQSSPGEFWWTTPSGHRYRRGASPPVRSIAAQDEIHELRRDLADLAELTAQARAADRAGPAAARSGSEATRAGPEARESGEETTRTWAKPGGGAAATGDDRDPPPF